jgi:hypothetical protein
MPVDGHCSVLCAAGPGGKAADGAQLPDPTIVVDLVFADTLSRQSVSDARHKGSGPQRQVRASGTMSMSSRSVRPRWILDGERFSRLELDVGVEISATAQHRESLNQGSLGRARPPTWGPLALFSACDYQRNFRPEREIVVANSREDGKKAGRFVVCARDLSMAGEFRNVVVSSGGRVAACEAERVARAVGRVLRIIRGLPGELGRG